MGEELFLEADYKDQWYYDFGDLDDEEADHDADIDDINDDFPLSMEYDEGEWDGIEQDGDY